MIILTVQASFCTLCSVRRKKRVWQKIWSDNNNIGFNLYLTSLLSYY